MNECRTLDAARRDQETARAAATRPPVQPPVTVPLIGVAAIQRQIAANAAAVVEIARRTGTPAVLVRERALAIAHNSTPEHAVTFEQVLAMALKGTVLL